MAQVIGIKFKAGGKVYYFEPGDTDPKTGDNVIVETVRGTEYGSVVFGKREVDDSLIVAPLKSVIRIATKEDDERMRQNKKKEKEAFAICLEKIKKHKLEMHLLDVEYTFDGSKVLFYFTAEGRIDFRELVKDLASVFRTRIELRQVGVRDEARIIGGLGVCGRPLCCKLFLDDFQPVSIKMAKEQGLSLNPSKISGTCGRLMCCLKYEQEAYEEFLKVTPNVGAIVKTPEGKGIVYSVQLLKGKVLVKLDKDDENVLQEFDVKQLEIIKDAKKSIDIELEEQELKELESLE